MTQGNRDKLSISEVAPLYEVQVLNQELIQLRWNFTEQLQDERATLNYTYINVPALYYSTLLTAGVPSEVAFCAANTWHKPNSPIRVTISEGTKREWLILKLEHEVSGNHPYISALLDYVKSLILNHVKEGDMNYYYLTSLFPEDEAIVKYYGGGVEFKSV